MKCNHLSGFYRYFKTKGKGHLNYLPNGEEDVNEQGEMYEGLELVIEKTKRCQDCHKKI